MKLAYLLPSGQAKAYLALAAVCIIWGTTYLGLRIAVTQFPPFLFSFLRFFSAGLLLVVPVLLHTKNRLPPPPALLNHAVCGLLTITVSFGLLGWAEVYISSGLAAIICSSLPIWLVGINIFATPGAAPNRLMLAGLAAGMAGLALIFGQDIRAFEQPHYLPAVVAALLSTVAWAAGSIWITRMPDRGHAVLNAGIQMLCGSLFLIPLSLLFDDHRAVQWSATLLLSLAYLSLIGSAAAYVCYVYALEKLPITLVSMYAYINPVIAVVLGWLILNEEVTVNTALAIAIILCGIYWVGRGHQV
jgi:drug/metabolite transporter (DMT)-like permease